MKIAFRFRIFLSRQTFGFLFFTAKHFGASNTNANVKNSSEGKIPLRQDHCTFSGISVSI